MKRIALLAAVGIAAVIESVGCSGGAPESTGRDEAATTVCGQTTVHGMDISHYDGTINWTTAKAAGIDFAFAKATESTTYVDPTFATNWAAMKSAGVVRGAYHFFRANADPTAQANHVVQTVGALSADDLPIVLDLETMDGQSGAVVAANALTFLLAVKNATGKKPIVYTSPGFIAGLSGTAGFASYSLWVANWGVSCPNVPSPWTGYSFWQSSSTGTVNGVPASAVDLDTFNGTLADLHAFGGGTVVPDAGTTPDAGGHADSGASSDGGGTVGDSGGTNHDGGTTGDAGFTFDDGGGSSGGAHDAGAGGGSSDGGGASGDFANANLSSGCAVHARRAHTSWLTAIALTMIAAGFGARRRYLGRAMRSPSPANRSRSPKTSANT